MRLSAAATADSLPTLRFEYTTCCLFYPTTLFVTIPGGTVLTAQGTGGATLTIPNAPGGVYFLRLQEEVGWLSNVWLEAKERIYLDTTLVRSGTYLKSGGPGYVYWYLPSYQTPVKIKINLASNELAPLGDSDNKWNPNYSPQGPDKRKKIIDLSRVKNTPMSVLVSYHDGTPLRNYRLTFRSFGKDTTGGHDHTEMRPGGRFLTALQETVYVMQQRTDTTGKVQTRYFCSGIGGVDSIYVRGTLPTDTATALVTVGIKGLGELRPGDHYKLVGAFGEPGVDSRHRANHYGTTTLASKLKALGDSVYNEKKYFVRINDMSLRSGGPFDIKNNWNTPHQNHRQGVSADIDNEVETAAGARKAISGTQIKTWLKKVVANPDVGDEGNHFHVTIR